MKSLKLPSIGAALAVAALLTGCFTADIRPDVVKNGVTEEARQKGRQLLERSFAAAGGLEQWKSYGSVEARFRDDWSMAPAPAKWLFMEYAEDNHLTAIDAKIGEMGNSRMEFLEGPEKGVVWGVTGGDRYYEIETAQRAPKFIDNPQRELVVENVEFFLGFPFYLASADQVAHLGEVELDGRKHDLVFLSWGTFAPQADVDQWQVWFDQETGLITQMEFTVRPMGKSLTGVYFVTEWQDVQGLKLPRVLSANFAADDPSPVHIYTISDVVLHRDARTAVIAP